MSETFDQLVEKAEAAWTTWDQPSHPQVRVQVAGCSTAAGALDVLDAVRATLQRESIGADVAETGCMGLCFAEVIVDILVPGRPPITYGFVTPENASTYVDYIPELEKVSSRLAEILVASRLGMDDIREHAAKNALTQVGSVVDGLKKLQSKVQ